MLASAFPISKSLPVRRPGGIPFRPLILSLCSWLLAAALTFRGDAQVPAQIHFQGRVQVGAADFSGTGQFKFALVSADGAASYWSNDGSSVAGAAPVAAVNLPVAKGVYGLLLGDPALANMTPLPADAFAHADVRLRVWFNDGANGFQQLSPDQRIASVAYAQVAASVPVGSITPDKLAATEQLSVSVVGELYARGFSTNPAPKTLPGTMTIDSNPHTPTNSVTIVQMAEERRVFIARIFDVAEGPAEIVPLIVRRPVGSQSDWSRWAVAVANIPVGTKPPPETYRLVMLRIPVSPGKVATLRLWGAFPSSYRVDAGTDGVFYETLTLQPQLVLAD